MGRPDQVTDYGHRAIHEMTVKAKAIIEAFYGRYGASVLARCRQLVHDEATAWDAMHQTFVRAIRAKHASTASLNGGTMPA